MLLNGKLFELLNFVKLDWRSADLYYSMMSLQRYLIYIFDASVLMPLWNNNTGERFVPLKRLDSSSNNKWKENIENRHSPLYLSIRLNSVKVLIFSRCFDSIKIIFNSDVYREPHQMHNESVSFVMIEQFLKINNEKSNFISTGK